MKSWFTRGIVLAWAVALTAQTTGAVCRKSAGGDVFSPSAIASLMKKVNKWQIAHPVMKGNDRNWVRATWYTGVMGAYLATRDKTYLNQAMRWSKQQQWQQGTEHDGANDLTCSQTYLELYFLTPNPAFIEPTIRWLNSGNPRTPSGASIWYLEDNLRYVDSLYVAAPTLAMLARATGDHQYIAWMDSFFWDVKRELFDTNAGLFYRDKRFIGERTANGRKVLWARGNGWAFSSLPRILPWLPQDDPSRAKYESLFKQMAGSLVQRQQPDGLWRPNLDDPKEFPMPETSGSSFFCYGLAWGVRNGLLGSDTFLPSVKKAWKGLANSVSQEGKVQWGQLIGDRPVAVKRSDSQEYVTGAFLLAGSEVFHLAQVGMLDK